MNAPPRTALIAGAAGAGPAFSPGPANAAIEGSPHARDGRNPPQELLGPAMKIRQTLHPNPTFPHP